MAASFKDLSAEVLAQILGYLPKNDLKSARLSSTRLGTIGASMLFDRVYFAPRKLEMERFRNIALHPVFGKNVKELVYDGRLFREEYREQEGYKEMYFWQNLYGQTSDIPRNADPLDLEHYSRCVDEQECILAQKMDYHALLAGLGQMPIRRLTVQDYFGESWSRFSIHNTEYLWYDEMCYRSFYRHDGEMDDFSSPTFSPSSWHEFHQWSPLESRTPKRRTWDCRGLAHLFAAVSESCHNVEELHIGSEESMASMIFFHPSNGIIDHIDRLAPRLTCLKLASKQYRTDPETDIDVAVSRLTNLMQEAKQLRTLSLSMNVDEQHSSRIFHGWGAWSHLSLLDLGDFSASQDDLAAAIVSQKDSLSELGIRCVEVVDPGLWERLADEIGQCLRLHKVMIFDLVKDVASDLIEEDFLDRSLPMGVQENVAKRIMQWVPPETLELRRYPRERYFRLVTASEKPGGTDAHAI